MGDGALLGQREDDDVDTQLQMPGRICSAIADVLCAPTNGPYCGQVFRGYERNEPILNADPFEVASSQPFVNVFVVARRQPAELEKAMIERMIVGESLVGQIEALAG